MADFNKSSKSLQNNGIFPKVVSLLIHKKPNDRQTSMHTILEEQEYKK